MQCVCVCLCVCVGLLHSMSMLARISLLLWPRLRAKRLPGVLAPALASVRELVLVLALVPVACTSRWNRWCRR